MAKIKTCINCGKEYNEVVRQGRFNVHCPHCNHDNYSLTDPKNLWARGKKVLIGIGILVVLKLLGLFDQGRPDITKTSLPPAKTEAQIEAENKAFAEAKAKAEAGDANAQSNLGSMYYKGQGVEQDFKEAVKWWQKAADQGFASAQNGLGLIYDNGNGVPEDDVQAYAWYNIAAANGSASGKKAKRMVAEKMTPAQIAEAEELVKEMVKKNPKLLK